MNINPTDGALSPMAVSEACRELSEDAQMSMGALAARLNEVLFLKAMQKGYQLACEDNGLPVPNFKDPLQELMRKL